ncbi:MAG: hypothetical protein K0S74_801 [Chlamydiales bacterium]|jgi:23S rRNA (uracil-5-)-methyltransferase RumA|nr:hypothetical protein [Chlamydiales bacterium]
MKLTDLNCLHFQQCSGCVINSQLHSPPIAQDAIKYFKELGIPNASVVFEKGHAWRCRAKLAIRGTWENPLIGLYEENSHRVVPIPHCVVHHPLINKAVEIVKDKIISQKLPIYCEETGQGLLRYIQCFVDRKQNKVQLSAVLNLQGLEEDYYEAKVKTWLMELWESGKGSLWHSIWVNFNSQRNNLIFGKQWSHIHGEEYLWEELLGFPFAFQPMVFSQANMDLFESILRDIVQSLDSTQKVIEYYAGIGVIGLLAAIKAQKVYSCETNPNSIELFQQTCTRWPDDIVGKMNFAATEVSQNLDWLYRGDVLIVDPPRKGLDPLVLQKLKVGEHALKQIIYLSCGWNSFKRDCDTLLNSGWKLENAKIYILFPGSNHIETLAWFEKV